VDEAQAAIIALENPIIGGRQELGPALRMHLISSSSSIAPSGIAGEYPAMIILPGDHFRARLGCLEGSQDCDVVFALKCHRQQADRKIVTLGRWRVVYDGQPEEIDIDLAGCASQLIRLILDVDANRIQGQTHDLIIIDPRIEAQP
jgi:hypothetical protein